MFYAFFFAYILRYKYHNRIAIPLFSKLGTLVKSTENFKFQILCKCTYKGGYLMTFCL